MLSNTKYDPATDAPEVQTDSAWLHSGEGATVTLVCRVYSNPAPRVTWYRYGGDDDDDDDDDNNDDDTGTP